MTLLLIITPLALAMTLPAMIRWAQLRGRREAARWMPCVDDGV